ncbi:MAG TPA: CcmD family protein [Rhodothermales bacterium]|nr:CcmD family protein [Rhodothermales bacterium]
MISFVQDTTQTGTGETTAYDSVWAHTGVPVQQPKGFEQVMLSEDKLYVVLAVVLIIWFGIVFFLFRTDRKIARLERSVEKGIPVEHPDHG